MKDVYVVGAGQTDFARKASRDEVSMSDLMREATEAALADGGLDPQQIQSGHIANFAGELFRKQGHLGAIWSSTLPEFVGLPATRHEAACASGSVALLAAMHEIQAGHAEVVCVVGVEEMRNVSGNDAARHLGAAAWVGREGRGAKFLWPHMFGLIQQKYDERYGLDRADLALIAKHAFAQASHNEKAQARDWTLGEDSFGLCDKANPVVDMPIRRHDCSQITDGAACVILATERFAKRNCRKRALVAGWGHRTGPMLLVDKFAQSQGEGGYMFPHIAKATEEARMRAGVPLRKISAFELHDCFTITQYMLIEHLGLTAPGRAYQLVRSGDVFLGGRQPVNPGGGLIGIGHPVGATGVRMVGDAFKQLTGCAGKLQVKNADTVQTVNLGGSTSTVCSFVLKR